MIHNRTLNINIEKLLEDEETLCGNIPSALREYANAVEKSEYGNKDYEKFIATNGCVLTIIADIKV